MISEQAKVSSIMCLYLASVIAMLQVELVEFTQLNVCTLMQVQKWFRNE